MENTNEVALGWDDEIKKENDFVLLQEGDYDFTVEGFERARFNGSEKMPACNQAILKIKVNGPEGSSIINHNLFLHSKTEWALSAFFRAIGQKKKDEPLKMNWNTVVGSKGRCTVGIKIYNENKYNEIKKFLPKDESTNQNNFTSGTF